MHRGRYFFGITVYYLCKKPVGCNSIKSSLRRAWLLERQILCYSLGLFVLTIAIKAGGYGFSVFSNNDLLYMGVCSFLPLASNLWWYVTSYVLFIISQPILESFLAKLGRQFHGLLAVLSFLVFSVPQPQAITWLGWTFTVFIYQYVVFSWIVWHASPRKNTLVLALVAGLLTGISGPIIYGITGNDVTSGYFGLPQSMPAMVIGFSLVLLAADGKAWSSRAINKIASCVLPAYLILVYPSVGQIVKKGIGLVALRFAENWGMRLGLEALIALSFIVIALVVDSVRRGLFSITVDRNKGGLFERIWGLLAGRIPEIKVLELPMREMLNTGR